MQKFAVSTCFVLRITTKQTQYFFQQKTNFNDPFVCKQLAHIVSNQCKEAMDEPPKKRRLATKIAAAQAEQDTTDPAKIASNKPSLLGQYLQEQWAWGRFSPQKSSIFLLWQRKTWNPQVSAIHKGCCKTWQAWGVMANMLTMSTEI